MLQKGNGTRRRGLNAYPLEGRPAYQSRQGKQGEDQGGSGTLFVFTQRQMVASSDAVSAH
jgi:hypothetical protein